MSFHAQTLPTFLSYAGAIISVLMIVTGSRSRDDAVSLVATTSNWLPSC